MLIVAPPAIHEEIANRLETARVQFTAVILGKQGVGTDGVLSLKINQGKPTAQAVGVLASWLGKNKSKVTVFCAFTDGLGKRVDDEITDLAASDVGLHLAQAQEITIAKKRRTQAVRRVTSTNGMSEITAGE